MIFLYDFLRNIMSHNICLTRCACIEAFVSATYLGHALITLFKSITMLCGINCIPHNILEYALHILNVGNI